MICGNGVLNSGEGCDPKDANSFNAITQDCVDCQIVNTCPDEDLDVGEECEPNVPTSFNPII